MIAREYQLMARCVEDGVRYGLMRAHKHCDDPSDDVIAERVIDAVMNEVCEWFEFPAPAEEQVQPAASKGRGDDLSSMP